MRIRKAVITAAGGNQRALPLQTLIQDGAEKSVLSILIEQALTANIGEICVVVWPGDETRYAQAAGNLAGAVRFVPQQHRRGDTATPFTVRASLWPMSPSCTWWEIICM